MSEDIATAKFVCDLSNCKVASIKGEQEEVYSPNFLKESLIRRYDKNWYSAFKKFCKEIRTKKEGAPEV
ncbi:hypothetical protein [Fodinibius halophilus]|uniref:DUF3109 family protein n=1 Tax=Fodinibius halophilus TaxID=1736908 RepID=A0A6M1SWR0_9BACT|nr:hypothetical protein [Fodinibius halophilus]NGP88308.1 DUF3109 family protein [Fodinibius halophilus]